MGETVGREAGPASTRWYPAVVVCALVVVALVVALAARPADSAARPAISVSPQDVAPGASVTTTGSGFPGRAKGSISFDGEVVATFTASRRGNFSKQWTVPAGARTPRRRRGADARGLLRRLDVRDL